VRLFEAASVLMSKSLRDAVVRRPWPALGLLAELKPRPAEILRLRFGIDDGKMMTLEQIGRRFKLTRERIRQLETEGLAALRDVAKGGKRLRALYL
jgi:DNA-directed RNA polymerase sigma subunit (sigma70/sigma32)